MVTVSQSSDLEAILRIIKDRVKPHTSSHEQQVGSKKNVGLIATAARVMSPELCHLSLPNVADLAPPSTSATGIASI